MTEYRIEDLPKTVWKLIVSYYSNPYRKVYALVRYEVDRDAALLRRIPEHQNWSLSSDSPEELLLRIAAEMPDEFCFGTDHFNNFAPQSIRFENIRIIKLDSFFTNLTSEKDATSSAWRMNRQKHVVLK